MNPLGILVIMHLVLVALVFGVRATALRMYRRVPRAAAFCVRTVVAILAVDLVLQAAAGYRIWRAVNAEPGADQVAHIADNLAIALNTAPCAIVLVAATLCVLGAVALAGGRR